MLFKYKIKHKKQTRTSQASVLDYSLAERPNPHVPGVRATDLSGPETHSHNHVFTHMHLTDIHI